jgi:hypothetical protein
MRPTLLETLERSLLNKFFVDPAGGVYRITHLDFPEPGSLSYGGDCIRVKYIYDPSDPFELPDQLKRFKAAIFDREATSKQVQRAKQLARKARQDSSSNS